MGQLTGHDDSLTIPNIKHIGRKNAQTARKSPQLSTTPLNEPLNEIMCMMIHAVKSVRYD